MTLGRGVGSLIFGAISALSIFFIFESGDLWADYRIGISLCSIIILGIIVYISGGWYPPIPLSWYLAAALVGLCLVAAVPMLPLLIAGLPRIGGFFLWLPWFLILLSPIFLYAFVADKLTIPQTDEIDAKDPLDKEVLEVAKRYGGVITCGVLVWELNISLEKAGKVLDRFYKHGEAQKKRILNVTVYDFPSARIYLAKSDNQIIELLRDSPHGLTRSALLSRTSMSIEALDESLKRLQSQGIINHVLESDTYVLRGITL